jgi:hypothetical protein
VVAAAIGIPIALMIAAGPSGARAVSDWEPLIVAAPMSEKMLMPGVGNEQGLQVQTILAERAISAQFPEVRNIGGARPDSMKWHPQGLAIDVGIPDYRSAAGKALGDRIAAFAIANADRFHLVHVIWQQTYFPTGGKPHRMANLGSDDANHYTHVHIATEGGGYPTGTETYLR